MAITTKYDLPLVSATGLNVPAAAVDDGSNVYGTPVYSPATTWPTGAAIKKGRALLVIVNTGALTSTPTGLKVGLYKGTDSSGSGAALVTGTDTALGVPAGNTSYTVEIDLANVSGLATDFYSLGLSSNGGGSTSVIAGATALVLDPTHV